MILKNIRVSILALLAAGASAAFAQNPPTTQVPTIVLQPSTPEEKAPQKPASDQATEPAAPAKDATATKHPDRGAAYYHFMMAHMYEEMVSMYGRSDYATKAIEEYRAAIENDPSSDYLNAGLAELYAKTGRIRDAVLEAQDILKRDGNNLEARRLLGQIYLRSLGDMQSGNQSQEILKLAIEQYEQIVKLDPKSVEDHLLLGRLYRLNNELLKSENEFKEAVKIQPDSEEAVTTLAYLYNEEGDSSHALQVLSTVPEKARTAKLYSALGYTYEQQKNYKQAVEAYKKSSELDPDNLDAVRGLAQNLMNDNETDAALEQYKAIVEADPSDAQTYMRIAEVDRRNGKFDQAMDALKKAAAIVPDSVEVQYNIALIDEVQGKNDDAAQILSTLLQKSEHADGDYSAADKNNRALFLERLGTIYRETNRYQLADDTFRKMLELGDENAVRGYQEIIETYRDSKQWQKATDVAEEAAKKYPNDRGLQMVAASQQADMGNAAVAIDRVKAMAKGNADDRDVYIALAQMYSRVKDWDNAETNINKAVEMSTKPEDKDYALFVAGSIYERQKKYDKAEEAFHKVLADDPKNAMALNYLGYMLADRGTRLDEALGYIRRAVALEPQNGAYLDSLGWVYYKMGNYDLAEENLRRASERMSNDPTVQDHLGELYQRTGRLKLAATHWERSLEEWNKTIPAEVDSESVAKVQRELESARVKLAKQGTGATPAKP
ncbi:MAG TPA: tetratricopeptide repeat protein [Terriglobales bacterium]|nr:tetratricopeptide repeat protein [Terriglobales bacterium]